MSLNILVIGDPVPELKPGRETTLALILEAQKRHFSINYCTAKDLCLTQNTVIAEVSTIQLSENLDDHIHLTNTRIKDLSLYDIILLRSNPKGYKRIETSYMLDILADKTFITNDPRGIRELHGKYFTTGFPDFIVPYAFVETFPHYQHFLNEHPDVIAKPVNGYGGHGVVRLNNKTDNTKARFDKLYQGYNQTPFILQDYIKDAVKGDKRIILFDGEPVCSILRVPKDESSLANITQGATVEATDLTLREQALCDEIGPILRDYGIFFAGVDMLGDYLTEFNVISVGTIVPANECYGIQLEKTFWDMLIQRYESFKNA